MGKGSKSTRGMNVLKRVLKRKRGLKKAARVSATRPKELTATPVAAPAETVAAE